MLLARPLPSVREEVGEAKRPFQSHERVQAELATMALIHSCPTEGTEKNYGIGKGKSRQTGG
jgi:hypothetical protein